jgi:hypothetical protein
MLAASSEVYTLRKVLASTLNWPRMLAWQGSPPRVTGKLVQHGRMVKRSLPPGGCGVSMFAARVTGMRMETLKWREIARWVQLRVGGDHTIHYGHLMFL